MNVSGQGGKGSARRKGANDNAYADNYDRIFNKVKCPVCDSKDVELNWIDGSAACPEYQRGDCESCGAIWNECARD